MSSWDRVKEDLGIARTALEVQVDDAVSGAPAAGLAIRVTKPDGDLLHGRTDAEGRARVESGLAPGVHTLRFETDEWYADAPHLFPHIDVAFQLVAGQERRITLSLSPFGYAVHGGSS